MPHKDPEARRAYKKEYMRKNRKTVAYTRFWGMIRRAGKLPGYEDVKVCSEWRNNHKAYIEWFKKECALIGIDPYDKNITQNWHVDKDYSMQRLYSPDTCILIPKRLNQIIQNSSKEHVEFKPNSTKCHYNVRIGDAKNGRMSIGSFTSKSEAYGIGLQVKAIIIRYWNKYYYRKHMMTKRAYDTIERYVQVMLMNAVVTYSDEDTLDKHE